MAYATVDDLERRYPGVTAGRAERAQALLEDVAVVIDDEAPPSSEPTEHDLLVREIVSCSAVRRALVAPVDQQAMVTFQQTTGPFSAGGTLADPYGDLYLSKTDRRRLGISRQRAGSVDLTTAPRRHR